MTTFELQHVGETKQLIILEGGKKTSTPIHRPLTGKHARPWPKLDNIPKLTEWSFSEGGLTYLANPLHTMKPDVDRLFTTLGRRIISGEVKWGATLKVNGKFRQTPKYWEWAEEILSRYPSILSSAQLYDAVHASLFTYDQDINIMRAFYEAWCSASNSLHTSAGEVSITLWDLYAIGGLPILGDIYDETTPFPDELLNTNPDEASRVPASCRYLLSAYHKLASTERRNGVTPAAWVRFWFKGNQLYKSSNPKPRKRLVRPNRTGNPGGVINEVGDWLAETKDEFTNLKIPISLYSEVYLAAFLSCWLCSFVLPSGTNATIRPSTFKPAGLMASGHVLNLAYPVLVSIYRGLNTISDSSTPGSSSACFPQHYLTTWMGHYFGTHHCQKMLVGDPRMFEFSGENGAKPFDEKEARMKIHSGSSIYWNAASFVQRESQTLAPIRDSSDIEQRSRFASIRPCVLSLRWKDKFILEPYNPHRFSRQFGFKQKTPRDSRERDIRSSTLDEGIKHWLLSVHEYPGTAAMIPTLPKNFKLHTTQNFITWWRKVHGPFLIDGQQLLVESVHDILIDHPNPASQPKQVVLPTPNRHNAAEKGSNSKFSEKRVKASSSKKRHSFPKEIEDDASGSEHPLIRKKKKIAPSSQKVEPPIVNASEEALLNEADANIKQIETCLLDDDDKTIDGLDLAIDDFSLALENEMISFGSDVNIEGSGSFEQAFGDASRSIQGSGEYSSKPPTQAHDVFASSPHPMNRSNISGSSFMTKKADAFARTRYNARKFAAEEDTDEEEEEEMGDFM